jgi:hypothetical protein
MFVLLSLPARGEILKEGISPLALNHISFVECPPLHVFGRRAEARRVRSMAPFFGVHGEPANTLDGF